MSYLTRSSVRQSSARTALRLAVPTCNRKRPRLIGQLAVCVAMPLAMFGCALPALPPGSVRGGSGSDVTREIEEADIIKLQDGFFYIANP